MSHVIGQTGRSVLSDETIQYARDKRRTLKYWLHRSYRSGRWTVDIIGPFHSPMYGVCGSGSDKKTAMSDILRRLANEYGYIGRLMLSDIDESDTVGIVNRRLLSEGDKAIPIIDR